MRPVRSTIQTCGVACFKKAYWLYLERGYRARLLSAAYRNFYHWTEFVGGEVSLTIPWEWQVKFNESGVRPVPRMDEQVRPEIVETLYSVIPDFRLAYDEGGLAFRLTRNLVDSVIIFRPGTAKSIWQY